MTVTRGTLVPLDSLPPFRAKDESFRYRLTPAERDVAWYLINQASTREIAAARGVSVKAVEGALTNIFGKLGVSNRQEAIPILRQMLARGTRPLKQTGPLGPAWAVTS